MNSKFTYEIANSENKTIKFDIRHNSDAKQKPLCIIFHGFKGYRNWGFFPYASEYFSNHGFISINTDFSYTGILDEDKQIYDAEVFAQNTLRKEVNDAIDLINYIDNNKLDGLRNWNGEIILIGHSLGGAVSIITQFFLKNRISKLILWASISKIDRNTERQKAEWREKGTMDMVIPTTGQKLLLNVSYLDDKELNAERYNLENILRNTEIPVLVLNGKQDVTVSPREAENLFKWTKNKEISKLHIIDRCGHTFNIAHPMGDTKPQLEELLEKTLEFCK